MKRYAHLCRNTARQLRARAAALLAAAALLLSQTALAAHLCPPGLTLATLAVGTGATAFSNGDQTEAHSDCHAAGHSLPQATALCIEDCRSTGAPAPASAEAVHDFVPGFVVLLPRDADPSRMALAHAPKSIAKSQAPPSSPLPLRI